MQSGAEDLYEVVWQSALWYMTFQSKLPTEHKTPGVLIKKEKNWKTSKARKITSPNA